MGYRFEKFNTIEICYLFICFAVIYDVHLKQLGFHPVAVVSILVQQYEGQLYTEGEAVHTTIQQYRIHKVENKHTNQENKHKKNVEEPKSSKQIITSGST
jgi:hypothetical protein